MFPLRSNLPTRLPPVVTLVIIGMNAFVYLQGVLLEAGGDPRPLFYYGLIPCSMTGHCDVVGRALSPGVTLFTSMFVHAGFLHVAGNMLYLWIFGANVEDSMGKARFAIFYLLCGLGAAYAQMAMNPTSEVPMVGASGAISGVLGAYLLLFPRARVLTLIPLGLLTRLAEIPAVILLGFWIVIQLFNGIMASGIHEGGVAWFAHVGGFVTGMLLVGLFKQRWVPWGWRRSRVWYEWYQRGGEI